MAIGVEHLWAANPTGGVSVGVYDDLCVDKVPGGDSFVQGLAKSNSGCHGCKWFGGASPVTGRIYDTHVMQHVRPVRVEPSK